MLIRHLWAMLATEARTPESLRDRLGASRFQMCTVPWELAAASSWGPIPGPLKARQLILASVVPLRSV